jgi:hypothetical protein
MFDVFGTRAVSGQVGRLFSCRAKIRRPLSFVPLLLEIETEVLPKIGQSSSKHKTKLDGILSASKKVKSS